MRKSPAISDGAFVCSRRRCTRPVGELALDVDRRSLDSRGVAHDLRNLDLRILRADINRWSVDGVGHRSNDWLLNLVLALARLLAGRDRDYGHHGRHCCYFAHETPPLKKCVCRRPAIPKILNPRTPRAA